MAFRNLVLETGAEGIALLRLNRPAKLNALNQETLGELKTALESIDSNPAVRGLILTGEGDKAFAAGADISEVANSEPVRAMELSRYGQRIFRHLECSGKPSIAAINGFALGGGLELAMACTLRVAAENAKLGLPEVKLGLVTGYGGSQRLPRLVGRGRALEMLLTGDPINAARAEHIGLVNHVVPQDKLLPFCRELLRKILANGPVAVGLAMQAVDTGLNGDIDEGMRFEATAFGLAAATEDMKEGTRAFLEKRTPRFSGK